MDPMLSIDRFPRIQLAALPTPLQRCPRLSAYLGGPQILVKRDDLTGRAGGGNKVRKLEFALAEGLAGGADTLVTIGVGQSNSVRQIAGTGAALGLEVHIASITDRVRRESPDYESGGNAMLTRLFGAHLHPCSTADNRADVLASISSDLTRAGRSPLVLPYGISSPAGALGYVDAGHEIITQAAAMGTGPAAIVHASGTGATQAGLTIAAHHGSPGTVVLGVDVDAEPERVRDEVSRLVAATSEKLEVTTPDSVVEVIAGHAGMSYGSAPDSVLAAVALFARTEGLVLDPVYSGVGAAGLIAIVNEGRFDTTDTLVFVHTGGSPGLHAYRSAVNDFLLG